MSSLCGRLLSTAYFAVFHIYLSVSLVSILISHLKGESSSLLQTAFFNLGLNSTKWTNLIIHNNKVHAGPAYLVKEKKDDP